MTPTARTSSTTPEPERELVRRLIPYGPPAVVLALVAGALAGGWGVGWSAAIGVAVIAANFAVSGLSVSRAARSSANMLFVVTGLGVIVRIGAIVGLLVGLRQFAFFSTLAFA